ncbi:MAG: hypothetical protein IPG46_08300 [Actinobacteria bacterium]|nr:hypothetical protein [Actinomycetota bacterium]
MRLVEDERRAVVCAKLSEFGDGRNIAIHREHGVARDQAPLPGMLGEALCGSSRSTWRYTSARGAAQTGAVDDGGHGSARR